MPLRRNPEKEQPDPDKCDRCGFDKDHDEELVLCRECEEIVSRQDN